MICIVDCGTEWLQQIQDNVAQCGYPDSVVTLDQVFQYDFGNCSGIIISGAPINLSEVALADYLKPFNYLLGLDVPILGICLGHQALGLAYGAELTRTKKIDKVETIQVLMTDPLFQGIETLARFREEHSEHITLPKGFCLLAKSASCANEAMRHNNRKIYGVQFHPEVSGEYGRQLIGNFLKICSE